MNQETTDTTTVTVRLTREMRNRLNDYPCGSVWRLIKVAPKVFLISGKEVSCPTCDRSGKDR